jgi:DUF3096 family protein
MVAFVLGLFLMLGLAVLPALSSPSLNLPSSIRMPTMGAPASWTPIAALVAGIVILLVPKIFHYVVAVYLILIGLIGFLGR